MPVLMGRRVVLVGMTTEDIPTLFQWRNSEGFLLNCTARKCRKTIDEFQKEILGDFKRDRYCQMMVKKKSDNTLVGTVYCYGLNRQDGHAFVTIYIDELFQRKGYGVETFALFVEYLFEDIVELHKVYVDVYEYNRHSLECVVGGGLKQEGRFVEHKQVGSVRYDMLRFALYRNSMGDFGRIVKRKTE